MPWISVEDDFGDMYRTRDFRESGEVRSNASPGYQPDAVLP